MIQNKATKQKVKKLNFNKTITYTKNSSLFPCHYTRTHTRARTERSLFHHIQFNSDLLYKPKTKSNPIRSNGFTRIFRHSFLVKRERENEKMPKRWACTAQLSTADIKRKPMSPLKRVFNNLIYRDENKGIGF